jgi:hypothetical protein
VKRLNRVVALFVALAAPGSTSAVKASNWANAGRVVGEDSGAPLVGVSVALRERKRVLPQSGARCRSSRAQVAKLLPKAWDVRVGELGVSVIPRSNGDSRHVHLQCGVSVDDGIALVAVNKPLQRPIEQKGVGRFGNPQSEHVTCARPDGLRVINTSVRVSNIRWRSSFEAGGSMTERIQTGQLVAMRIRPI